MGTDNRNNGNNRYSNNRSTGRNERNSYSGANSEYTGKTVRKVENTRFYERENPESNMRRVGRTSSDFDAERRSYTGRSHEKYSDSENSSNDGIPEFKSFRRTRGSYDESSKVSEISSSSSSSSSYSRENRYDEKKSVKTDKKEEKTTDKKRTGGLYDKTELLESDYDLDEAEKTERHQRKSSVSDRVNRKREDKKKLADLMARSDDRSHRRRAVSRKRDRKIRTMQFAKAAIVVLIIVVVLLITLSKCDYDDPYGTAYVTSGSIEFLTDAKVSFIREEEVCTAPVSGVLVPAVNEGDKVPAGATVAYITTAERTELIEQLADIEEKIKAIENLNSSSSDVISADVAAIDKEIETMSKKLAEVTSDGRMEEYTDIKNELDALIIKRNELASNSQSESSYLTSLKNERDLIKERIKIYTKPVIAQSAGVVSFYIDGNESTFTEYSKLLSTNSSSDIINASSVSSAEGKSLLNSQVGAGAAVVKVITSYDYYVAAVTNGNVSVQSGRPLSVKSKDRSFVTEIDVVSVSYSAGKTMIIGKTNTSLVSSLGDRMIEGEVMTGKYEGMKIPLSSLTEFDSTGTTARLTLVRSNYVVYAYVNILAKDNEYAIISDKTTFSDAVIKDKDGNIIEVEKTKGVSVNDIFVLKPEYVKEGDHIS